MSRFFHRIGVTLKKALIAREQDRADIKRYRGCWRSNQKRLDPSPRVFIDDTPAFAGAGSGPTPTWPRLYGWASRGRRLVAKIPHGPWKKATFLAALRNDRIDAPCVFDRPINGERFLAYIEQFPAPTLKRHDIVVLDSLGSHKGKAMRNAIKAAGPRLLFLLKYSPDLNRSTSSSPSSKTTSEKPRPEPLDVLSDSIAQALTTVPPDECANSSAAQAIRSLDRRSAGAGPGASPHEPVKIHGAMLACEMAVSLPGTFITGETKAHIF